MLPEENKSNYNKILFYGILMGLFFFLVLMPLVDNCEKKEEEFESLPKNNNNNILKIDTQKCAKSCCLNSNWELPPELRSKDMPEKVLKNYIPSNYSCNFGTNIGSGCVCITEKDKNILSKRGGNAIIPNL